MKEVVGDIDNLDDLTYGIDEDEDPEWTKSILNEYFEDTPPTLLMDTTPTQPRIFEEQNNTVNKFVIAE